MTRFVSGFHAIEEVLRAQGEVPQGCKIFFSKAGPRAKKILSLALEKGVPFEKVVEKEFSRLLCEAKIAEDEARGIFLQCEGLSQDVLRSIGLDEFLRESKGKSRALAIILDSVTDPRNAGAILRSAAQFGCGIAVLPSRGGAKEGEAMARSSAGAAAFVPIAIVPNIAVAVEELQKSGFWVYAADAAGEPLEKVVFAPKSAIVVGSEGAGISRLVKQKCDSAVGISTTKKIDSLNVSVAAGIFLHAAYSQGLAL